MNLFRKKPIETDLAKGAFNAADQRDPEKIYHLMKASEFAALMQEINARLAAVHPALRTGYSAATLAASGTGAVEAMLAAFAPRPSSKPFR